MKEGLLQSAVSTKIKGSSERSVLEKSFNIINSKFDVVGQRPCQKYSLINALTAVGALMTLTDFTLS